MDKKKIINSVRKYALLAFIIISVFFNVLNYVKVNELKETGTPYQWEKKQNGEAEKTAEISEAGNEKILPEEESVSEVLPSSEKININHASAEELQQLTGIGEAKAKAIVEYRTAYGHFTCIEELMEVKGIGEGIFSKIKENVTVE